MSKIAISIKKLRISLRKTNFQGAFAILMGLAGLGCENYDTPVLDPRFGFSAIVFASRSLPSNAGNLTDIDRYVPGGNVFLLEPAAPGGNLIDLTGMENGDVLGLDVSPDGKFLVASIKTGRNDRFHLYLIEIETGRKSKPCFKNPDDIGMSCTRITFGPSDDTRPFYLRNGNIGFVRSDPDGPVDLQSRGRARILYAVNPDGGGLRRLDMGSGHSLGAAELSENTLRLVRVTDRDGSLSYVPFEIEVNSDKPARPDARELFVQSVPMNPVEDAFGRWYAACVPVALTWGAGTLCEYRDGSWQGVVQGMPAGDGCAPKGRIRDPYPLADGRFLVSYVHVPFGCTNYQDADLGKKPVFGLAVLDPRHASLRPVFSRANRAEMYPKPVMKKPWYDPDKNSSSDPPCHENRVTFQGFVGQQALNAGAVGIRVIQAFWAEVAPWSMETGGLPGGAICRSPQEDAVILGHEIVPVFEDGSFRFTAPAEVPLRLQVIDRYAAALETDPIWRGAQACRQRSCSGCHPNDGVLEGFESSLAAGYEPHRLDGPSAGRTSYTFEKDIQPILNRSCAVGGCHDPETSAGNYATLSGQLRGLRLDDESASRFSQGYENLLWLDVLRDSGTGRITDSRWAFVTPGKARVSRLMVKLGVPCRYACENQPAWAPWGQDGGQAHPEDQTGTLSNLERWKLVEWIDMGAPFYGLEAEP